MVYLKVAGLSEVATKSAEEVMRMLQRGNKERTQEPTAANKTSSRSHALLMVNVTETSRSKQNLRNGRLYMIDLAGSERASNTKVSDTICVRESCHLLAERRPQAEGGGSHQQVPPRSWQLHQRLGREEDQICELQRQQAHQVNLPFTSSVFAKR